VEEEEAQVQPMQGAEVGEWADRQGVVVVAASSFDDRRRAAAEEEPTNP